MRGWLERGIGLFDRPLPDGTVLHHYRIEHVLGMGSYGFTYLVTDLSSLEQKVAKQLRKSKRRLNAGRKSFAYEQRILKQLNHPAIPRFLDSFIWKNELFFIMEYIQGRTFEQLIFEDRAAFSELEAFRTILNINDIVAYVHKQGIVHRDLRIPNILVQGEKLFLIDFGLARYIGERDERENEFAGEKKFMREIHYRSDFYALGHFLLFLLYSGYTPVCDKERPWYEELSISPRGTYILKRMLQIEEPYQNAKALNDDIQFFIKEREESCFKNF
ncbi:MAG: serine/threonine protein kinase [Ectobacillus sp.]